MHIESQQLKEFAIDMNLLTSEQAAKAEKKASESKKTLEEVLLSEKMISDFDLAQLKSYVLGIPYINLEKVSVPEKILNIVPEQIAKKFNIVAFKKVGDNLEVGMLDPGDLQTVEFIKKKTGLIVLPRLADEKGLKNVLAQYQKSLEAEFGELVSKKDEGKILLQKDEETAEPEKQELEKAAEDLPIIRIVDTLIKHAILQSASDIHIEPHDKEVMVRYRVDGILHDAMILPVQVLSGIVARIKVLSNLKIDEHRLPQDGRFKVETGDYKVSFRVSTMPVYGGEKVVMRLLREQTKLPQLEELGLRGQALHDMEKAIKRTIGMILVTGPTGSGKTTTLYTVLNLLNTPEVNICTVEDPIEYRMKHINQTQVSPKIGMTFANGLRALLRQDPNIIMVGEIRDNETASLAINAALTGHLVLSTLHTNNAAGAIPRLVDMEVEPFLMASTLNVVLAQRLVRKLYKDSKEEYILSSADLKNLSEDIDLDKMLEILRREEIVKASDTWKTIKFYRPKPAKECPMGYKGRLGIYEVLDMNEEIKELIEKKASFEEVERRAVKKGMVTMLEDGFIKAARGITSIEEVLRVMRE